MYILRLDWLADSYVSQSQGGTYVVCTENAHDKSLIYSGMEALSKPSTGWGNLQGQEMKSFLSSSPIASA